MTKREAGSKGGAVSTPAKAEAVKRNGAKGGRPREYCPDCQCAGSQYCGEPVSVMRDEYEMQLSCTKRAGHSGEHWACSLSEHPMHRWPKIEPDAPEVKAKRSGKQCRTKYGPSVISRDRERAEHARKYEDSQS